MPKQIGRYQIKSELGQGGMAAVYHAFDPGFQREVAVKVLPPEFLRDPTLRARFEREARMIAGLEHPAIVPVYDVGEEDGQPYLVMRFMPGGALSNRLESGPLPIADIARIIQRIGSALDEAHKRGIIHRDLKPGNILFDQYGEAYLSDFGIARSVESQGTLTGYGGAIGTPGYMSPEQIQGDTLDNRSDIYALGIVAFEMLTGQNPFRATSPAMSMVKQMTESLPALQQVKPELPPEVDDVIRQATAREREERTPSAAEVARLLAEAAAAAAQAAGLMAAPEQPSTAPQAQADNTVLSSSFSTPVTHSNNRKWFIVGAIVIIALVFIGYFALNSGPEPQPVESANKTSTEQPVPAANTPGPTSTKNSQTVSSGAKFETETPAGQTNPATNPPTPTPTENSQPQAKNTPAPTATINADATLYDNFDDPTYDGTVNTRLWRTGTDTSLACNMRQENGLLITTNELVDEEIVCSREIPQVGPGKELGALSARMKIADNHNGYVTSVLKQFTSFIATATKHEYYEIRCGIDNIGPGVPGPVVGFTIYDTRRSGDTRPYFATYPIEYDRWYDVRLEVDPQTMTFSCLVDGEEIASYSPTNVEELRNAVFGWRGLLEARHPGAVATTYIDDVRLIPADNLSQTDSPTVAIASSKPVASTATPVPEATPTITQQDVAGSNLYDDFDDPAYDGAFNPQLWRSDKLTPLTCDMRQENGSLLITNEAVDEESSCRIAMREPPVPGRELTTLSARIKLAGDHNGKHISSMIRQVSENHDIWCGFGAAEFGATIDFVVVDYRLDDDEPGKSVVLYIASPTYAYDQWYDVRLEVDPTTMTFACLIDGEEIGRYTFPNAAELQNENFNWRGLFDDRAPGAVATTYIDDFRLY